MAFKRLFIAFSLSFLVALGVGHAQVAPAALGGGRPIGIGVGFSDYSLDYGHDRRMVGPVVRGGVELFHGLGVEGSARSLFMFTPPKLIRMQQSTFVGGGFYRAPSIYGFRAFARGGIGLGIIEFPSDNPKYTRDSYTIYSAGGGLEHHLVEKAFVRAEYEYQSWRDFRGPNQLNPQGFTLGVTYYLNEARRRARE